MIYDGLTLDEMISFMQAIGLRAERGAGADDVIFSSTAGWRFAVYLLSPSTEGRFDSVQFYASHNDRNFTVDDANDWNNKKRFTKARSDRDGYPVIVCDIFVNGVRDGYLRGAFAMWEVLMARFLASIGQPGGKIFVGDAAGSPHGGADHHADPF
jgi:hypothetical protein